MKPIYSDHKINYTALIEFFKYNSFYYLKFSVLTVLIYFIYFYLNHQFMKLAYHFILTTLIQITILLFLLLFRVQA